MSQSVTFFIDGQVVQGQPGQTIIEAAQDSGVYIPRLCHREGLSTFGACRVCTVLVNGRPVAACTTPITEGMMIENDTDCVQNYRKDLIDMLFVEGNHFCMFCEKSGNCELQALAYRFRIPAPKYLFQFPLREIDASHPDLFIDRNRCILCGRCVRASKELDGKNVFQFVGRGVDKRIAVNADQLSETDAAVTDQAMDACPVGAILKKHVGYTVPVGKRTYDHKPIGADIEESAIASDS